MTYILKSAELQFALNPKKGTWSLYGSQPNAPAIEDAWMRVSYKMGFSSLFRTAKRKFQFIEKWHQPRITESQPTDSCHGPRRQLTVEMGPDVNGIVYQIDFSLLLEHPLLLWRIKLIHTGKHPISLEKIDLLRAGFFPKRQLLPNPGPISMNLSSKPVGYGTVRPHPDPGDYRFYVNGWQSWSYSGAYGPADRQRATRLGFLGAPMWYADGLSPRAKKGIFSSDMFGVLADTRHRSAIVAGFLAQKQHFSSLNASITDPLYPALDLWADGDLAQLRPGGELTTDWAALQFADLNAPDPLAPYLNAVALENGVQPAAAEPEAGWCSWYHFFQDIDEPKMQANLNALQSIRKNIPLKLFQIDDGFEAQIGDWFEFSAGFPQGVAPLAAKIRAAGLTPGLWLAPFILHSKSKLAKKRKWLLRNRWGLPVNAGFVWNNFNKALDLTRPEALAYVVDVVQTAAREWDFSYLKLDFLYAAALKTARYHDRTRTRAQVLRMGLESIRQAVGPDVTLLGCGLPLGSAVGVFDAMRISADVAPGWAPEMEGRAFFLPQEPNFPATRNALQNILSRAMFHKRWWINDPDCLMIRPDSNLTLAEVRTLAAVIALTGGALLLSDDLPGLPGERLGIAEVLLPLIGKRPQILDVFDSHHPGLIRLDLANASRNWHLLGVLNWADTPQARRVDLRRWGFAADSYFAREFWQGETQQVADGLLNTGLIPAHGIKVFALRPLEAGCPCYLGSDLHISQGLEVTHWSADPHKGLQFTLQRPGESQGVVELYLPETPQKVLVGQTEVQWRSTGPQRYLIPLKIDQVAQVQVF